MMSEGTGASNKLSVVFGEVSYNEKDKEISFPPEKAGKKLMKSAKEIWKETSETISIKAEGNTARILEQLKNSKIHKDVLKNDEITH